MESDWLPDNEIRALLKAAVEGEPTALHSHIAASPLRATDSNYSSYVKPVIDGSE